MKPLVKITGSTVSFIFKKKKISYELTVDIREDIDDCQKLVDDLCFGDSIEFYNGGMHVVLSAMGIQNRFLYQVFNYPPQIHGYAKIAGKSHAWEKAIEEWNIQCRKVIKSKFKFN